MQRATTLESVKPEAGELKPWANGRFFCPANVTQHLDNATEHYTTTKRFRTNLDVMYGTRA
jgi:hypothetical protein